MASYTQLVKPNLSVNDAAGWCLRHTQSVFGAPAMYATARDAWDHQSGKHFSRSMPNVSVPVWFKHLATYNGIYKDWGHVVAWVPGRGFFSSPGYGYGNAWFSTLSEVEVYFGGSYFGWTEYMHTKRIVKPRTSTPKHKEDKVKVYRYKDRKKRKLAPKQRIWLTNSKKATINVGAQVGDAHGPYTQAVSVYGDGFAAGDIVEVKVYVQNSKNNKLSAHYEDRIIADKYGMIRGTRTFNPEVAKNHRLLVSVYGSVGNKKTGTVSLLDSNAYLHVKA